MNVPPTQLASDGEEDEATDSTDPELQPPKNSNEFGERLGARDIIAEEAFEK